MGTEESEPTQSTTPEPNPPPAPQPPLPATPDGTPSAMPQPTQSDIAAPPIPKTKVVLNEHGATAKIRNPWLVALFCLITFGIYYLFWYYFVNREMADYGEANGIDIGHSPGMSVVAITIGSIIIVPPFVSIFHTGTRMRITRRVAGRPGGSAGIFFVLSILPLVGIFAPTYLQSELNGAWERLPAAPF
jgi:Domain of unknown function (DUF4234)